MNVTVFQFMLFMLSEAALFNFAALHSDNSFEIFVDQNLVNSGSLLEDMRSVYLLLTCGKVFVIAYAV